MVEAIHFIDEPHGLRACQQFTLSELEKKIVDMANRYPETIIRSLLHSNFLVDVTICSRVCCFARA